MTQDQKIKTIVKCLRDAGLVSHLSECLEKPSRRNIAKELKMRAEDILEKTQTKFIKFKTYQEAWDKQETFENQPHGWVQWKGTNVCIDIHCVCGESSHFDGSFMYVIQCPSCNRKYFTNGHVQLIEIEDEGNMSLETAVL